METKELTCIGCPLGCRIRITLQDGQICSIDGNTCKNGEKYARKELTAPTRIVTTTVAVAGGTAPVVSAKTAADIPKEKIFDCIRALQALCVPAPVVIGQVLLADAAGTGVDVVATKNVEKR